MTSNADISGTRPEMLLVTVMTLNILGMWGKKEWVGAKSFQCYQGGGAAHTKEKQAYPEISKSLFAKAA